MRQQCMEIGWSKFYLTNFIKAYIVRLLYLDAFVQVEVKQTRALSDMDLMSDVEKL